MNARSKQHHDDKRKRRSQRIQGQFAPRCIDLLESPAYRVLNLAEHRVLNRIEIELAHHGGLENGNLPITYLQFSEYGARLTSVASAIRVLEALGIIGVKHGRGGNAEFREPNRFRLTYRGCQTVRYGDVTPETNEWRRIKTIEEARQIAKRARQGKNRNRTTKRSVVPHYKTYGEKDRSPHYETYRTGALTKRSVLSRISGGGGAGDGLLAQATEEQSKIDSIQPCPCRVRPQRIRG